MSFSLRQTILAHYIINLLDAFAASNPDKRAELSARFDLSDDIQTLKEQPFDALWTRYQALYHYCLDMPEPLDDEIPWL